MMRTRLNAAATTALLCVTLQLQAHAAPPPAPGDAHSMVIGGKDVAQGRYPFMVALHDTDSVPTAENQFCGGTLIHPEWVLTAAHCVKDLMDAGKDADPLLVSVNRADLDDTAVGQTVQVDRYQDRSYVIYIHPDYDTDTFFNDVALIKLARPVNGITPVRLPTMGSDVYERPGALLSVAGWGSTSNIAPVKPWALQETTVPLIAPLDCEFVWTGEGGVGQYDRTLQLCAGVTGHSACNGDSGGPLFVVHSGLPARVTQIGIVSDGKQGNCDATGYPGIFTRLSAPSIQRFIRSHVPIAS